MNAVGVKARASQSIEIGNQARAGRHSDLQILVSRDALVDSRPDAAPFAERTTQPGFIATRMRLPVVRTHRLIPFSRKKAIKSYSIERFSADGEAMGLAVARLPWEGKRQVPWLYLLIIEELRRSAGRGLVPLE